LKGVEKTEEKAVIEVCPLCGSKMEKGFYIVNKQTWWDEKKHTLYCGKCEEISPFRMTLTNFPGYRCRKCELVIFRYGETDNTAEGSL
jgi:DNA-directed RNA polymerase subunit RPC12/RpoP